MKKNILKSVLFFGVVLFALSLFLTLDVFNNTTKANVEEVITCRWPRNRTCVEDEVSIIKGRKKVESEHIAMY